MIWGYHYFRKHPCVSFRFPLVVVEMSIPILFFPSVLWLWTVSWLHIIQGKYYLPAYLPMFSLVLMVSLIVLWHLYTIFQCVHCIFPFVFNYHPWHQDGGWRTSIHAKQLGNCHVRSNNFLKATLPETKIAPEKMPFWRENHQQPLLFRCYMCFVSLRESISLPTY